MKPVRIIMLAAFLLLFTFTTPHAASGNLTPQSSKPVQTTQKPGAAQLPSQPSITKKGDFKINPGILPSITITAPAGGENWKAGTKQTVRWKYTGDLGNTVRIVLRSGTGTEYLLHANAYTDYTIPPGGYGRWEGDIPDQAAAGSGYRVVVSSNATPSIKGTSNPFTVKPKPVIKLVSPTGGEVWHKGYTYNIKWTYSGDPDSIVSIWLFALNGTLDMCKKLAEVPISGSGTGSYNWTIPSSVERRTDWVIYVVSGHYLINSLYGDHSNAFTIDELVK